jgi:hypothetical protein
VTSESDEPLLGIWCEPLAPDVPRALQRGTWGHLANHRLELRASLAKELAAWLSARDTRYAYSAKPIAK